MMTWVEFLGLLGLLSDDQMGETAVVIQYGEKGPNGLFDIAKPVSRVCTVAEAYPGPGKRSRSVTDNGHNPHETVLVIGGSAMTWAEMRDQLSRRNFGPKEEVQAGSLGGLIPAPLVPAYAFSTVRHLFLDDGEEPPRTDGVPLQGERCVLMLDVSPYSEDGDFSYTLQDDLSLVGDQTGKVVKG